MSLDKLRNCPRCGELFVFTIKDLCPRCIDKIEQDYQKCAQFLRRKENRRSTMTEMSEKTGVSISQIMEFIRQKRLLIDDAPHLGYPCDGCGTLIRSGRLCATCSKQWKKSMDSLKGESPQHSKSGQEGYFIHHHKK